MKKKKDTKQIVIFQAKSGAIQLRGDYRKETIWATLDQIAAVFGRDKSVISRHLNNVYKGKELNKKATVAKIATVQKEGNRSVTRDIEYYNLDAVISVGYRVNSKVATEFRKWATKTLREHITRGYTINRKQIAQNYEAFMKSVSDIQALLPEHITLDPKAILDLVKEFSSTWMSLDAYDKDALTTIGTTKKSITLSGKELTDAIANFRFELMKSGSTTEIFAQERAAGSVEGIVGNVMQSFGGKPVYESSDPKKKEQMTALVTQLLK